MVKNQTIRYPNNCGKSENQTCPAFRWLLYSTVNIKCFDNKNVVVASWDAKIYSVVQGDTKTTNRLYQKNRKADNHLKTRQNDLF
jgi:hypothetical protein